MSIPRLVPYRSLGAEAWDRFVRAHPHHAPGHLSATLELEQRQGAAIDASFALVDEADRVVAVCPLVDGKERQLRIIPQRIRGSGTWFAAGPLADTTRGAKVAAELLQQVVEHLVTTARQDGVHRLLFSYPAVAGPASAVDALGYFPLRRFGFTDGNRVTQLIRLEGSEETLFAALDAKARNKVRRAEGLGCVVEPIDSPAQWASTWPRYAETLGPLAMRQEAFVSIYDAFIAPGDAVALQVLHEGRVACVVTVSMVNGAAYYWLGFGAQQDGPPGANVLGLWRGILLARARGARLFEVGSLDFDEGKQGRIAAFKQQFGGRPCVAFTGTLELTPFRHHALALLSLVAAAARRRFRSSR